MINKQDKSRPEKLSVSMHPDTATWVRTYAQQMDSDLDYVVEEILKEYRDSLASKRGKSKQASEPVAVATTGKAAA